MTVRESGDYRLVLNSIENSSRSSQRRLLASRIILFLTILLLLVMPITEHLWTWDGFLRGGHDVELGLLSLLVFCGLVALSAYQVLASPLLLLLLAPRLRRSPWRSLLQTVFGLFAVCATPVRPVERLIDLSVPLSLLSLRL